jgi:hypothetical protein
MMKRRAFITLLGGAAAWPLAARAQQPERMRRIGVLMNLATDDREGQARLAAFVDGLQQSGWQSGRNLHVEVRWGAGDAERFRQYATELVALAPEVILAGSGATMPALRQATRSVPIVFTLVPDPVGAGFVASLARPGGNVTGRRSRSTACSTSLPIGSGRFWLMITAHWLSSVYPLGRGRSTDRPLRLRRGGARGALTRSSLALSAGQRPPVETVRQKCVSHPRLARVVHSPAPTPSRCNPCRPMH